MIPSNEPHAVSLQAGLERSRNAVRRTPSATASRRAGQDLSQSATVGQLGPQPGRTRRVMCSNGTCKDIPEADIIPNEALTFLQQSRLPYAYRNVCAKREEHDVPSCTFVHVRTYRVMRFPSEQIEELPVTEFIDNPALALLRQGTSSFGKECEMLDACANKNGCSCCHLQPRHHTQPRNCAPVSTPTPPSLFIGVVVDGFCFTKQFGWGIDAFTKLTDQVTSWISQAANAKAVVHSEAKVLLFPNTTEAQRHHLMEAQTLATLSALDNLRSAGWTMTHTNFKLVAERWKATAEDVAFSNECAKVCRTGALAPLGANHARITLHHVVIVTADSDHVSTFDTQSNNELRWLVDINPSTDQNLRLRRAARESQRLIPATFTPLVTAVTGTPTQPSPHVTAQAARIAPAAISPTASAPAPGDEEKSVQRTAFVRKNPWAVVSAADCNPFPATEKCFFRPTPSVMCAKLFRTKADRDAWWAINHANYEGIYLAKFIEEQGSTFQVEHDEPQGPRVPSSNEQESIPKAASAETNTTRSEVASVTAPAPVGQQRMPNEESAETIVPDNSTFLLTTKPAHITTATTPSRPQAPTSQPVAHAQYAVQRVAIQPPVQPTLTPAPKPTSKPSAPAARQQRKPIKTSAETNTTRREAVPLTTCRWTFRIQEEMIQCQAGSLRVDFSRYTSGLADVYINDDQPTIVFPDVHLVVRLTETSSSDHSHPFAKHTPPPDVFGRWTIQRLGPSYEMTNSLSDGRYVLGATKFLHVPNRWKFHIVEDKLQCQAGSLVVSLPKNSIGQASMRSNDGENRAQKIEPRDVIALSLTDARSLSQNSLATAVPPEVFGKWTIRLVNQSYEVTNASSVNTRFVLGPDAFHHGPCA